MPLFHVSLLVHLFIYFIQKVAYAINLGVNLI